MSATSLPKRFYRDVTLKPLATGGFHLLLDGRELKTPAKNPLMITHETLANALRDEWDAQEHSIDSNAMPHMRIHAIATDRITLDGAMMMEDIVRYAETDLICYYSDDAAINARQHEIFSPIHAWWNAQYNIPLATTMGLMPVAQHDTLSDVIMATLRGMQPLQLTATALITPLLGSVVLALALHHGAITADAACIAARIEEDMAAERYGTDPLAVNAWQPKARDIHAASLVLNVLRA